MNLYRITYRTVLGTTRVMNVVGRDPDHARACAVLRDPLYLVNTKPPRIVGKSVYTQEVNP